MKSPSPRSRPTRSLVIHLLTIALMGVSVVSMYATLRLGQAHGNDFKHLWAGARMLAAGDNPYAVERLVRFALLNGWNDGAGRAIINPYVYLPTTGLLMRPLAWLTYPRALTFWFVLNFLAAWGLVLAGPDLLRLERRALARLAGAAFLVAAFPFYRQMTAGQMNVVTAWLVLGAVAALLRRRDLLAGALLGVGFAWKIAPALLIVLLPLLGRWRAAVAGALVGGTLWLVSFVTTGPAVQADALAMVTQMGYGESTWAELGRDYYRDPFNQSPNALLHHLLTANPYTRPWLACGPATADRLTILVSFALIAVWLIRRRRLLAAAGDAPAILMLAGSLAMLLLPSLMWDHYVVQALPVLLWTAGDRRTSRSLPRALGLLILMAVLCWPVMHARPEPAAGPTILLLSIRLWPVLALYLWLLLDRPAASSPVTPDDATSPAAYWAQVLDPQNLERRTGARSRPTLEDELAFADAPDFREAAQWLEAAPAGWTLDLGAGLGVNSFALVRRGHRVIAVDTSLERLRALRERAHRLGIAPDRLQLVVAAAESLPFPSGTLPRLFTHSVLIHTDLDRAGSELARVLPSGGRGAFAEPQPGNPFAWLYRRTLAPTAWAGITRYFGGARRRDLLHHFRAVESDDTVRPYYLFSFLAFVFQFGLPAPVWFHRLLVPLNRLDSALFRRFSRLRPLAWFAIMTVQKEPDTTSRT